MGLNNRQNRLNTWRRYGLALAIFSVTLGIRFILLSMNIGLGYLVFYPGMVLAFACCGTGPGGLLTVLAALSGYFFFFEPYFSFGYNPDAIIGTLSFLVSAILIAAIITRLKNAESHLEALIQNSAVAIITIEPKSKKFTAVNPAAQRLWGYSAEELLSLTIQDLTPADEWDISRARNERLFSGEVDSLHFEKRYLRKDGSLFWGETHASTLKNANGKVSLFIGHTVDISERKSLELRLREENAKNAALLRNASDGIHILDYDGYILEASDSFCAMLGYPRQEVIGMHVSQWDAGFASFDEQMAVVRQQFNCHSRCQFETRHRRKDGTIFDVEVSGLAMTLKDAPVLFNSSRDISDRKQLTAQLVKSRQELEDLYDHAPCGYHSVDASGTIIKINATEAAWFGYAKQDMLGKKIIDFFTPEGQALFQKSFPRFLKQGHIEDLEFEIRGNEQGGRFISLNATAILDDNGDFVMSRSVLYDISQIKQAQDALAASEERFRTMANTAPVLIWQAGLNKQCYWFNDIWLSFTGRTLEQEYGDGWAEGVHPEDIDHCLATYFSAFDQREPFQMEFRLRRHDGEYHWVHDHGLPLFDHQGHFSGYIGSCIDVSDSKTQALRMQALSQEQQAMLDNELIGIVKVKNRRIVWKNKAMDRIFAYSSDELLGCSTERLYPDTEAYLALGDKAYPILHQRQTFQDQILMQRKDGQPIWIDLNGMLLNEQTHESMWLMSDITALKQHDAEVTKMAYHDVLTGLPNRLLVSDRLHQAVAQAERSEHMLAICYIDLDDFKPVNDNHGHEAGDLLLKEIANRMQASVRGQDTVGRLGGDEFVLLLTDLESHDEYQAVLQRLISAINQPIALSESVQVQVGASIGITLFPMDHEEPEMLLRHADQAMYRAKQSGRNRVCEYADPATI